MPKQAEFRSTICSYINCKNNKKNRKLLWFPFNDAKRRLEWIDNSGKYLNNYLDNIFINKEKS